MKASSASQDAHLQGGASQPDGPSAINHWLLWLPAYIALGLAIGAAIYCLSSIFLAPEYTDKLWVCLGIALVYSYCLRCGGRTTRDLCAWLLVLLFVFLPPIAMLFKAASFLPPAALDDGNAFVAAAMGWLVVATVLVAGLKIGRHRVPLTAPLVPALSLFGLMNIMSINPQANSLFLVFVGAALYIGAYERALNRWAREADDGESSSKREKPSETNASAAATSQIALMSRRLLGPVPARGLALQAFLACAFWLTAFGLGGTLFFYPVTALLPTQLSMALSHAPLPREKQSGDWRTSAPIVELKGGDYPLSNRLVARITVQSGEPSGLWRTNIYQYYNGSHWRQTSQFSDHAVFVKDNLETPLALQHELTFSPFAPSIPIPRNFNMNSCGADDCRTVVETVAPLDSSLNGLLSSGQPLTLTGELGEVQVHSDGTANISDSLHHDRTYTVKSQVTAPNTGVLLSTPGLTDRQRQNWLNDYARVNALIVPDDATKTHQLRKIAIEVLRNAVDAHHDISTPARKVQAISEYLVGHCLYTLNSPAVPGTNDAVLFFLTRSHRGACDMFASSMVLLLRTMGVPARLVTGYLQPAIADNEDNTVYTLRDRDAHAWVQYFVPKFGWIEFDATQGTRSLDPPAGSSDFFAARLWSMVMSRAFFPISALLLIAFAASFLGDRKTKFPWRKRGSAATQPRISALYKQGREAVQRHVDWWPHLTPQEYETAVTDSTLSLDAKREFAAITYLYVQSQYSAGEPPLDVALAQEALLRLRQAVRAQGKDDRRAGGLTRGRAPFIAGADSSIAPGSPLK